MTNEVMAKCKKCGEEIKAAYLSAESLCYKCVKECDSRQIKENKVEIIDEENSIIKEDDFDTTDFQIFPEDKKFTVSQSIKDDCFYNYQTYEYKISANHPLFIF